MTRHEDQTWEGLIPPFAPFVLVRKTGPICTRRGTDAVACARLDVRQYEIKVNNTVWGTTRVEGDRGDYVFLWGDGETAGVTAGVAFMASLTFVMRIKVPQYARSYQKYNIFMRRGRIGNYPRCMASWPPLEVKPRLRKPRMMGLLNGDWMGARSW